MKRYMITGILVILLGNCCIIRTDPPQGEHVPGETQVPVASQKPFSQRMLSFAKGAAYAGAGILGPLACLNYYVNQRSKLYARYDRAVLMNNSPDDLIFPIEYTPQELEQLKPSRNSALSLIIRSLALGSVSLYTSFKWFFPAAYQHIKESLS